MGARRKPWGLYSVGAERSLARQSQLRGRGTAQDPRTLFYRRPAHPIQPVASPRAWRFFSFFLARLARARRPPARRTFFAGGFRHCIFFPARRRDFLYGRTY